MNELNSQTQTMPTSDAARLTIASHHVLDSTQETRSSQQWEAKFPPLELVTKPNLTTEEIAYYTNKAEQTWRLHACKETYPAGLRPFKIGRDLNWPTAGVKKLCGV